MKAIIIVTIIAAAVTIISVTGIVQSSSVEPMCQAMLPE